MADNKIVNALQGSRGSLKRLQFKFKAKETEIHRNKQKNLVLKTNLFSISLARISYIYFNVFSSSLFHSARWIPHGLSGGPVPRCRPGGLRLQHPSDRRVHADDHRLHHGRHLRALHAASVSHGVPMALRPLPPPTRGLCRRHITPKMIKKRKKKERKETVGRL